jgi:hypothetical protein
MNAIEMAEEGTTDEIVNSDFRHFEQEDHSENIYRGCCNYSTDKRLLILGTQIGLSASMLIFSAVMVAMKENEDSGLYMSLITSILSFWMGRQAELEKK